MKRSNRSQMARGFTLIELMIVVAIVGVLSVLAVVGVRQFIANAKTAEARNTVGAIGKAAAAAYEVEHTDPTILALGTSSTGVMKGLCPKAVNKVPADISFVTGKKYQSSHNDWSAATPTEGFACLRFELDHPQYYMYDYQTDAVAGTIGTFMIASAEGDLDGNGKTSKFSIRGEVAPALNGGGFHLAPAITEVDPTE